ncbi:hypothetical protein UFOVP1655_73 [uncultured Caudovirales phage]|jgi:hypothetical protein|uniref:Uncharacterized protein n=1 Tax=uncultured Caudovirales phage TaxID=2100421 RepID=A0A6J5T6T3_9CAUD|nr:hypothetical protein UFOVP1655_73 [uncultured Caudovirales phage]
MTWLTHIDIKKYREKYNLVDFIETGCWQGAGIGHAFDSGYDEVYSCDIGLEYVTMSQQKFPYANIEHSESLSYLTNLLPNQTNKTLFWLDAHFPDIYGEDEFAEEFRIPLIPEIELIKKLKPDYSKDVVVCDDMRTFRSPKNPTYTKGELPEKHLIDVDWDKFVNILSDTHDYELINKHDGVIVFYPKTMEK